jgi:hypothetical protein
MIIGVLTNILNQFQVDNAWIDAQEMDYAMNPDNAFVFRIMKEFIVSLLRIALILLYAQQTTIFYIILSAIVKPAIQSAYSAFLTVAATSVPNANQELINWNYLRNSLVIQIAFVLINNIWIRIINVYHVSKTVCSAMFRAFAKFA